MPPVKFDRIVSCSSEDAAHPSKNLLLSRDYNRKWKCKEPGEERVSVIIQLTEPHVISGIDIGNESSSFVEVLVSRTSTPDNFEVLLVMSSFMTPTDARGETNRNRVRMFSQENLSDPVRKEKWDRIKVVCTQPFNKHLQYGLSFIVLHTNELKQERPKSPAKALGRFAMKDEDESNISVGSFFSRRKDLQESPARPNPLTGAAAIRDASSPSNLAEQSTSKKRKGSDDLTDSQKKKRGKPKKDDTDSPSSNNANAKKNKSPPQTDHNAKKKTASQSSDDSSASKINFHKRSDDNDVPASKANSERSKVADNKPRALDNNAAGPSSSTNDSSQVNRLNLKQPQNGGGNVTYKPFNKLLEGVEIVMSGYENPGRAHIREKAIQMGSKYNGNWSSSSTHLICAFTNTPKFRQVQGKGIIVTREWIDDCFQERKKLSWRRYATDKNERKHAGGVPEPEVWELLPDVDRNNDSSLPPVSRRNDIAAQGTRLQSDSDDSEDEIERVKARQNLKKKRFEEKVKKDLNLSTSNKPEKNKCLSDSEDVTDRTNVHHSERKKIDGMRDSTVKLTEMNKDDHEEYNCSTDVDSEGEAKARLAEWSEEQKLAWSKEKLPPLPDFFKDKRFFLPKDLPDSERQSLSRYIVAFGGEVLKSDDKSAHYIVSNKKYKVPEGSKSTFITPDWIWECNDRQRLIPAILHEPD